MDTLNLVVSAGASIHETPLNRPIGTFYIRQEDSKSVEFFQLLQSEKYQDFGHYYSRHSMSAIHTSTLR